MIQRSGTSTVQLNSLNITGRGAVWRCLLGYFKELRFALVVVLLLAWVGWPLVPLLCIENLKSSFNLWCEVLFGSISVTCTHWCWWVPLMKPQHCVCISPTTATWLTLSVSSLKVWIYLPSHKYGFISFVGNIFNQIHWWKWCVYIWMPEWFIVGNSWKSCGPMYFCTPKFQEIGGFTLWLWPTKVFLIVLVLHICRSGHIPSVIQRRSYLG